MVYTTQYIHTHTHSFSISILGLQTMANHAVVYRAPYIVIHIKYVNVNENDIDVMTRTMSGYWIQSNKKTSYTAKTANSK